MVSQEGLEPSPEDWGLNPARLPIPPLRHGTTAEAVGFEPTVGFPTSAFKADAFGRSATPPRASPAVSDVVGLAGFEPAIPGPPDRCSRPS